MAVFSNGKQNIPKLFVEIMRNQKEQEDLKKLAGDNYTMWQKIQPQLKELQAEMARFRIAAEEALHWNSDKGKAE